MLRKLVAAAAVLSGISCGIPEQSLRDEQLRTRRYRDAYESAHDENQDLRARNAQLELTLLQEKKRCAPPPADVR